MITSRIFGTFKGSPFTLKLNGKLCTKKSTVHGINGTVTSSLLNNRIGVRYFTRFGDITEDYNPALGYNESLS
jgi:hypothetical protein